MTTLTLETPEARAALARCVRLLLMWADEAEENETAVGAQVEGPGALTAAGATAHEGGAQSQYSPDGKFVQTEEKHEPGVIND